MRRFVCEGARLSPNGRWVLRRCGVYAPPKIQVAPALREQPGARHGKADLPMQQDPSAGDNDVLRVIKAGIHERLTRADEQRPWAVSELVLDIGDPIDVMDALADLHEAGLVHRCGDFAWATRARATDESDWSRRPLGRRGAVTRKSRERASILPKGDYLSTNCLPGILHALPAETIARIRAVERDPCHFQAP